jgi:hypothetical protein
LSLFDLSGPKIVVLFLGHVKIEIQKVTTVFTYICIRVCLYVLDKLENRSTDFQNSFTIGHLDPSGAPSVSIVTLPPQGAAQLTKKLRGAFLYNWQQQ